MLHQNISISSASDQRQTSNRTIHTTNSVWHSVEARTLKTVPLALVILITACDSGQTLEKFIRRLTGAITVCMRFNYI